MAVSKIPMTTNNSDAGYCKMPDGTLICWGGVDFPPAEVGRQSVIVTFPSNFKQGTVPRVVVSWRDNSIQLRNYFDDWIIIDAAGSGYNQATFVANRKIATWDWIAHYIAIGRWK